MTRFAPDDIADVSFRRQEIGFDYSGFRFRKGRLVVVNVDSSMIKITISETNIGRAEHTNGSVVMSMSGRGRENVC